MTEANASFECSLCLEKLDIPAPAPNSSDSQEPMNMPGASQGRSRKQAKKKPEVNLAEVVTAKCGHLFHKVCIMEWLQKKESGRQCPICRKEVPKKNGLIRIYFNGSDVREQPSEEDLTETEDETKDQHDLLKKIDEAKTGEVIKDEEIKTLREDNEKLKRQIKELGGSETQSSSGQTSAKRSKPNDEDDTLDLCKTQ